MVDTEPTPETAPVVRYEVRDGFAVLTLDSPHNRNALSSRLVAELLDGLERAGADEAVRGVVLTHTGTTFCAGADLKEALDADPAAAADIRTRWAVQVLRRILELPKPVVARIDGNVRAGGMGIVAACDIVVAGRGSSFALTEARLGLAPFIISLTLLPRMTSRAAARYFQTGETFDADTAERIGLITIAADDTAAEVSRLCGELRKGSPQGLAESKRLTTAHILAEFDRSADDLAKRSGSCFGTPDVIEGMTAFFQRRPPSWAE
ncbi:enoyl-CoA hydratase family protein [Nocardia otitidiscaviarum]|uniref:enoyl-CoA hydratase family protein n=1 Tax=Nocardia otitidiscaviarum TaxID=1823 RepID=UPI0004A785CC|nr:enoyl-CoA hydratase family protein [Nocardia otitidiscaviarum]MBF6137939.1 enoyl-CoA hydratase family protein [Nocardia otitidiscaviarum]MBF6241632.1 enoyl-CoA hydratase family protein [Nocardia otitidiscaviarum]MBF6488938.1 enoyl-CoA hydratase family protein [Nocardia otitidiscaviarum]